MVSCLGLYFTIVVALLHYPLPHSGDFSCRFSGEEEAHFLLVFLWGDSHLYAKSRYPGVEVFALSVRKDDHDLDRLGWLVPSFGNVCREG